MTPGFGIRLEFILMGIHGNRNFATNDSQKISKAIKFANLRIETLMADDGNVRKPKTTVLSNIYCPGYQSWKCVCSDYLLFYFTLPLAISCFGFCVLYFNNTTVRLNVCSHV